ncbi:MAG: PEP-CTERM sorting domain-containing protein [Pirellulales bacterium]
MKNSVQYGIYGMLLGLAMSAGAAAAVVGFDGSTSTDFLDGSNWDDGNVPTVGNQYVIANGLTSTYSTAVETTVSSLIVGGDYPQMAGDFGTPGTLNMSTGKLIVSGGGNAFQIARACCNGTGIVNLTGDAVLEVQGSDPVIGARDVGELHVGPNASVISTRPDGAYWRVGNYGPAIDNGLEGNGLLDVQGSFSAHVIFLGDSDSTGELRISGNGSVALTDNLVPNVATNQPNRSALVHMIGSSASLTALNLESFNGAAQVHNKYLFTADAGGVSDIKLSNAVNVGNNDLSVDLTAYSLAAGSSLLLFDAAPGQIYGDGSTYFSNVNVIGGAPSAAYYVSYDFANGDISLVRTVPEPASLALVALGLAAAAGVRRRTVR